MARVRDAIILAGGMGTRMLPASLYMPKETMPLIDTPILNHLVWEATKAGATRIHLVLSERKMDILGNFLKGEVIFDEGVRVDLPRVALSVGSEDVEIIPYIQERPGGVADAISVALTDIEGPFLVLLGDMVLIEEHFGPEFSGPENASSASLELVIAYEKSGLPCVGLWSVENEEVSNYGVVGIRESGEPGTIKLVNEIVEKPSKNEVPSNFRIGEVSSRSNFILCGRYLLPENTSQILEEYPTSRFGELQSISMLDHMIKNGQLEAVILDHMEMYDSGDPFSWLKSQIDHGLRREDISEGLLAWLSDRLA